MIYKSLNDIPLYLFNKVLLGDKTALIIKKENETDEEIEYTCDMLVNEYSMILGNSALREVCIMYEEALNLERMLIIAQTGLSMRNFITPEAEELAIEASRYLGFNSNESVFEFLEKEEKKLSQRFGLAKLRIKRYKEQTKGSGRELTEKDLADERATLIMAGIPIDQHKLSALEYACILRQKMEEIKAQKRALKK